MIMGTMLFGSEIVSEFTKIYWPKINTAFLISIIVVVVAVIMGMIFTASDQLISTILLVIFHANM